MKIPFNWLKEFVATKHTAQEVADLLTTVGLEVDGIDNGVLEVSLTPNLAHCASIRGTARELAALTLDPLNLPQFSLREHENDATKKHITVNVENTALCPHYACRMITGVRVGPSPDWLQNRLALCGMRSINAVVDVTNMVLLELGHPLHAFDFETLAEKRIVVRNAKKGEQITTLDGKEHYPTEETLLICDGKKPIAIAAIMGSSKSEVTHDTTTVLLESAYFEPSQVRRAAKRMGIRTEASYRFERGVDPNGVLEALDRAAALICELTGGSALQGTVEVKSATFAPRPLSCRLSRANQILGTQLAMSEVETLFQRLGLKVTKIEEDLISVIAPTFRNDLHHEIDLIEEIARLYGYCNIQKKEKALYRTGDLPDSPEYVFGRKVRCRLIAEGLQEFLTCDLISPTQAALISTDTFPSRNLIKLLNPHSVEQSVMRPSLLPGILSVIKCNADHDMDSIAGFEVGRVHFTEKGRYFEPSVLSIVMAGERAPPHWTSKGERVDFFDLKGIVENLCLSLKIGDLSFSASHFSNFHPKRQAAIKLGKVDVGMLGEVHPTTLKDSGLKHPVYFAELNLTDLHQGVTPTIRMRPLPQYPASTRDWTVTVSDQVGAGQILSWIQELSSTLLETVSLLDVYKSNTLGSDLKNVTIRFVYRDPHKTVSLSAVDEEHQRLTTKVKEFLK